MDVVYPQTCFGITVQHFNSHVFASQRKIIWKFDRTFDDLTVNVFGLLGVPQRMNCLSLIFSPSLYLYSNNSPVLVTGLRYSLLADAIKIITDGRSVDATELANNNFDGIYDMTYLFMIYTIA
jgi:hypothetical protein